MDGVDARYLGLTANQLAKIATDLKSENAKLRDERDRMYKANVEKNGEILRLLEENAKLRELVQDYDAMFAIAAKNEAATSIILPLDAVINALRIRAGLFGIEVD